jgi:hypothetical protein
MTTVQFHLRQLSNSDLLSLSAGSAIRPRLCHYTCACGARPSWA